MSHFYRTTSRCLLICEGTSLRVVVNFSDILTIGRNGSRDLLSRLRKDSFFELSFSTFSLPYSHGPEGTVTDGIRDGNSVCPVFISSQYPFSVHRSPLSFLPNPEKPVNIHGMNKSPVVEEFLSQMVDR